MDERKFEEAVRLFQRSNEILPHFKTLELQGECLIRVGRPVEAIVPLAAAASLNKGVRAVSLLAQTFLDLGDREKSFEWAQEALKRDAKNRQARKIIESLASIS